MNNRMVVLVADDSEAGRAVLRSELQGHGYDVVLAENGRGAVDLARENRPRVILLDVEMPEVDGFAALEALRQDEETARIPVILVTSRVTPEEVAEGLRRGAYDYLRKPFEPAELLARVRAAERTRDLHDELRARNAELQALVRTDLLTNTSNRRNLDEHLHMVASGARRLRTTFSLLMIDIDRFRRVNDAYGRSSGDEVLRVVARRVKSALRGEDIVGRWGGEEFLVVLPHTPLDGGWHLAERVRQVVSDSPVLLEDGRDVLITVSVGCAEGYGDDIEDHIRRADAALYEAKDAGRNRVVADVTVVGT